MLDAGPFEPELWSFRLHLAAEGKAVRTVRNYAEGVCWFAAEYLLPETDKARREEVDRQDVQRWAVRLLSDYSTSYAANQVRAIRRFLRWLASEDGRLDPVDAWWRWSDEPFPSAHH